MSNEISSTEELIDSRDIIERIEDLESEISDLEDDISILEDSVEDSESTIDALEEELGELDDEKQEAKVYIINEKLDRVREEMASAKRGVSGFKSEIEETNEELQPLIDFASDCENYCPDWIHGTTLIHEDYFTTYCKDMLADCGDIPADVPSYVEIDWDATAENLKVDYTTVEFDGETFYMR